MIRIVKVQLPEMYMQYSTRFSAPEKMHNITVLFSFSVELIYLIY